MPTLLTDLRKTLERTCIAARNLAERAAKAALETLAVHHERSYEHMNEDQRKLREKLRARAKQLGDERDEKGNSKINHLAQECAYEHWHRMLFARFLAENSLLIEPETGVAVSLDEVKELAKDAKTNLWALAGRYAQTMLPEIFRADDSVLQVLLAREDQLKLEELLDGLPADVFTASDSLGWCYQFWQAEQKETVNKSGNKIGADELPSVTQLFTEDYMVDFLLDNTLGAWHAGKVLAANPNLAENANSEEELRRVVALPGCPWKYLRFVKVARPSRSGLGLDEQTLAITEGENLPHWTCNNAIYHLSFRLADSVPQSKREEWLRERESIVENAKRMNRSLTEQEEKRVQFLYSERIEKYLDDGHGECCLAKPEIAAIVENALKHFDGERYRLHAWAIMPNHVHVVVEPVAGHELSKIIHSWKSFAAHEANKTLGRTGDFWQHDAYNHIIRNEKEYGFQVDYVYENPAKAGLRAWQWRWKISEPDRDGLATLWAPAADTFDGWPKTAKELRCLDPCMGSGHFVVAMFERLVALRMAEEKLDEAAAVAAVIRDNLFGLEIDPRCTQIGAFNLALAAWRRVGHRPLPAMNLACSGLAPNAKKDEWTKLAGADANLLFPMGALYELFQKAPLLGSLIDPRQDRAVTYGTTLHELQPLLDLAMMREKVDETHELAVTARGLVKAAEILAGQFTLVATNVPYLGRSKQENVLKNYCDRVHPEAKANLATSFVERCLEFCCSGGTATIVTPHDWLFLGSYKKVRRRLLQETQWNMVVQLGPNAFQNMNWWAAKTSMVVLSRSSCLSAHYISGLDLGRDHSPSDKALSIQCSPLVTVAQDQQIQNPDSVIILESLGTAFSWLNEYADVFQGVGTTDLPRFVLDFWEIPMISSKWEVYQKAPTENGISGFTGLLLWEKGQGELAAIGTARKGLRAKDKMGVAISVTGHFYRTRFFGPRFDNTLAVLIPKDHSHLTSLATFVQSEEFVSLVRKVDQALSVTESSFVKVPFDLAHWKNKAAEQYPHGLPKPFSSDPTQWLFNGQPKGSDQPLHVGVARLLGYQWPRQTGSSFPDCPALGPDGLEKLADDDGIVCLPSVRGEAPAAERLRKLLAVAFGKDWKAQTELELIRASGSDAADLEEWLRNDFFEQHCDLFHQRPFIWHIWDGRKRDGFHALVNYHKLCGSGFQPLSSEAGSLSHTGRRTLENLTHSYLGDWITRQKDSLKRGEEGADERVAAALALKERLEAIIEGKPPYDIFVRWKPLNKQAIGWEPDINDGVRINIRPFLASDLPNGKKGAGILRSKPNIKWEKDRGNEPQRAKEEFPWFWKDEKFTGERANVVHLTNDVKAKVRKA